MSTKGRNHCRGQRLEELKSLPIFCPSTSPENPEKRSALAGVPVSGRSILRRFPVLNYDALIAPRQDRPTNPGTCSRAYPAESLRRPATYRQCARGKEFPRDADSHGSLGQGFRSITHLL